MSIVQNAHPVFTDRLVAGGPFSVAATILAGGLLVAGPLVAGGSVGSGAGTLDPDLFADRVVRDGTGGSDDRFFGLGGRFAGDVNGDGNDDILLQDGEGTSLLLWFGDSAWKGSVSAELSSSGDLSLSLPTGCLRDDGTILYAALGDLNGDGLDDLGVACADYSLVPSTPIGAFALWFGRSSWP
ncbi:MAG: VCBS repeat-containing protein, partial [Myxococcota bacterium]|nr:VCBS repeat-containing protein [Myxococcota bacterium]